MGPEILTQFPTPQPNLILLGLKAQTCCQGLSMCQTTWCPSCKAAAVNQRASLHAPVRVVGPLRSCQGAGGWQAQGPRLRAKCSPRPDRGVAGSFFLKGDRLPLSVNSQFRGLGSRAAIWVFAATPPTPPDSQVNAARMCRHENLSSTSRPPAPAS